MTQRIRQTKFQLYLRSTLPRAHQVVYDMLVQVPQTPIEEQRVNKLCELISRRYGYITVPDQKTTFELFCEEMNATYGSII